MLKPGSRALACAECALAAVLLAGCMSAHITDARLFQPGPCASAAAWPAEFASYQLRPVAIMTGDGVRLEALVLRHARPRAALLYLGGNSLRHCPGLLRGAIGRAFLEGMAAQGVSLVLVNHRGYGASEGRPSVVAGKADALVVADFVQAQPELRGLPLIVHGQSLGSVLATHVALNRPVRALVLESPPTTIRAVINEALPWYARPFIRVRIAPELSAEDHRAMVAALRVPVLLTTGTKDELTPPDMARALQRRITSSPRLALVKGGRHGDLVTHPEFWAALGDFLDSVVARQE